MPFGPGEAFFIAEVHELRRQGCEILIAPREPRGKCINKDAEGLEHVSVRMPLINTNILAAAIGVFVQHPIRTLRVFRKVLHSRNLATLAKNIAVFPKALWLAKVAQQWGADHIHAQWALTTGTMGMVASEITGVSWSCTAHRGDIADDNLLAVKADHASFFRFISESGITLARSRGLVADSKNSHVLHMGVVLPPIEQIHSPPKIALRLLCAANLLPVKGHRYLFEALLLLKNRGVACHLDVAGGGPLRDELQALVRSLGIDDRVRFMGIVAHDQLLQLYCDDKVDVVILPSLDLGDGLHEGIPVTLVEAMSHGIPVISTTTGGIPELLRDGAGILVPQQDPAALADAIERILGDVDLRKQLSDTGRRRVEEDYNVQKVVARLMKFIHEAIPA